MQSKIHEQLVEIAPMMVMVMEAALKTEDQVVSPTGMEIADPEAPAPWTGQK